MGSRRALGAQLDRQVGQFVGDCTVDAVAIVPDGWIWGDLTTTPLDQTAELLTPTDVAATTELLEGIVADGGVVVARGPLGDDGDVAELTLSTYVGDFTYGDTPEVVDERLALLGLGSDARDHREPRRARHRHDHDE